VFVCLAREPSRSSGRSRRFHGKWTAWNLPCSCGSVYIDYDVRANWKLIFQNYSECYTARRCTLRSSKLSPPESGGNDLVEGPVSSAASWR